MMRTESLRVAMIEPVGGHGGMDYYDDGLCRGLLQSNVNAILYTSDETLNHKIYPLFRYYQKIYGKDYFLIRALRYLMGSLKSILGAKSQSVQLLHFHFFNVGLLELFNVIIGKLYRFKIIITAHDIESFVPKTSVRLLEQIVYRLADGIITHNIISKQEIISSLGLNQYKIRVIPHGNYLEWASFHQTKEVARKTICLPQSDKVLLFFGQIKEIKGLDLLLKSLTRVVRIFPEVKLVIAGKVLKGKFDKYLQMIKNFELMNHCITRIHYIPNDDVQSFYAAADLVILPYRRIYQSGVLLMAMSFGTPVLASDLPGMREVITDGETGYLFENGNTESLASKIIGILSNSHLSSKVAKNALRLMENRYGWKKIGEMTAEYYREVI